MPFVFSATTTLVVPDRFFFLLTNIVKRPFAYPKIRVCKDTKYCLSINYKMDIFEWRSQEKADKNLPVIKHKRQLLDKQKLSKSCLYILSLNVVLKNKTKLANLLSSLLVCAFKLAQPDFVIAYPKILRQRVLLFSDVLPSALFGYKPPCSKVA